MLSVFRSNHREQVCTPTFSSSFRRSVRNQMNEYGFVQIITICIGFEMKIYVKYYFVQVLMISPIFAIPSRFNFTYAVIYLVFSIGSWVWLLSHNTIISIDDAWVFHGRDISNVFFLFLLISDVDFWHVFHPLNDNAK